MKLILPLAAAATAVLFPLSAGAAVIAEYNAATGASAQNPNTQGWSESIGNANLPTGSGSETIEGTEWRYWGISNTASAFSTTYRTNLVAGNFTDPEGWTATARLRVQSAESTLTSTYLQVRDGASQWQIVFVKTATTSSINFWGLDTDSDPEVDSRMKLLVNQNLAADYITLQLHFDPATQKVNVYLDGTQIGSSLARSDVPTATSSQFFINFGDGDVSGRTTRTHAYWNQVMFETGNTVIPEAGTSALLLGGAGVFALWAKSRRRP